MICSKCNHNLPDDSEFCQYCGSKIQKVTNITDNIPSSISSHPFCQYVG